MRLTPPQVLRIINETFKTQYIHLYGRKKKEKKRRIAYTVRTFAEYN